MENKKNTYQNQLQGADNTSIIREILYNLIEEIPEGEMAEVIDFIGYLNLKREKEAYMDLLKASDSSIDFWINDKDDEVWNNV